LYRRTLFRCQLGKAFLLASWNQSVL